MVRNIYIYISLFFFFFIFFGNSLVCFSEVTPLALQNPLVQLSTSMRKNKSTSTARGGGVGEDSSQDSVTLQSSDTEDKVHHARAPKDKNGKKRRPYIIGSRIVLLSLRVI